MLNRAIELHDALLLSISRPPGTDDVVLEMAVFLHVSTGTAGLDAGSISRERIELRIREARIHGEPPDLPCRVDEGELSVAGDPYPNIVPLPLEDGEPAEIDLLVVSGDELSISGSKATVTLVSRPSFVDAGASP